jgi:hypothetical protein
MDDLLLLSGFSARKDMSSINSEDELVISVAQLFIFVWSDVKVPLNSARILLRSSDDGKLMPALS